jgi:hypothetical protein
MKRRGLALVLLLVGLGAWLGFGRVGTHHQVVALHFGASAAEVREAHPHFQRDGAVAGDLALYYPTGAPAHATRDLRLRSGDYDVGVRLVYQRGGAPREWHVSRHLHTSDADAPIDLEIP